MAKAGFYHQVSLRWQWTCSLWTPTWYKQFCFPLKQKAQSYILSYINPLNTDSGVMDTWYKHFHSLSQQKAQHYISLFITDTYIWYMEALRQLDWHIPFKDNLIQWIWLSNQCKFWFCSITCMCQLYLLQKWELSTALLLFWFSRRIISQLCVVLEIQYVLFAQANSLKELTKYMLQLIFDLS